MELIRRIMEPTPKIFKKLRTIGIALAAAGGAVIAAPVALPTSLVTAAGYMMVAGTVMSAVSQVAVDDKRIPHSAEHADSEPPGG